MILIQVKLATLVVIISGNSIRPKSHPSRAGVLPIHLRATGRRLFGGVARFYDCVGCKPWTLNPQPSVVGLCSRVAALASCHLRLLLFLLLLGGSLRPLRFPLLAFLCFYCGHCNYFCCHDSFCFYCCFCYCCYLYHDDNNSYSFLSSSFYSDSSSYPSYYSYSPATVSPTPVDVLRVPVERM